MPCNAGRLKQALFGLFAAGLALGCASTASAQSIADILAKVGAPPVGDARAGQATAAQAGPVVQGAVGAEQSVIAKPEPFGSSLFANTSAPVSDAVSPDYIIQSGDRISISMLGGPAVANPAMAAPVSLVVDPQGNIFVPEIGPIRVAGVRTDALQAVVEQAASRVFTTRVSVYAVLQTVHRVGVYVAGFVKSPGRYGGSASDSALEYLVRSGGVDPSRGSYRNIQIIRGGMAVAQVDLYQFLLTGEKPGPNLREGDTILVGEQNAMVEVTGAVRNAYLFELPGVQAPGSEIIGMSRPLPSATHAAITGTRETKPFSTYVTLGELASTAIRDQDEITIVGDEPAGVVKVQVQGSRIGPSYLVLPSGTTLTAALDQIKVNPASADKGSVFILRKSIADQQRRVVEEAMDRLQRSLYLATSSTAGVSAIRASEATMITTYIDRARRTPPEGRLVVTDSDGRIADVRLENDDIIVIPSRSQTVLVSGEVLQPQAVLWESGMKPNDYVKKVGGYSERGRKGKQLVRRANGEIIPGGKNLRAGDELVILPYVDPKVFQLTADVTSLLYQVAVAAAALDNVTGK